MKKILLFLLTTVVLGACTSDEEGQEIGFVPKGRKLLEIKSLSWNSVVAPCSETYFDFQYDSHGRITQYKHIVDPSESIREQEATITIVYDLDKSGNGKIYFDELFHYPDINSSTGQQYSPHYDDSHVYDTLFVSSNLVDSIHTYRGILGKDNLAKIREYRYMKYDADKHLVDFVYAEYQGSYPSHFNYWNDPSMLIEWVDGNIRTCQRKDGSGFTYNQIKYSDRSVSQCDYSLLYEISPKGCIPWAYYTDAFGLKTANEIIAHKSQVAPEENWVELVNEYNDDLPIAYTISMSGDMHQWSFTWQ